MTNEQILEQQVEALEKLLQLKQAVIDELESKVQKLQNPYPYGMGGNIPITIPSVWTYSNFCPDGTPHQYPSIWGGTGQPCCVKCGAIIYNSTSGTLTIPNSGAGGTLTIPNSGAGGTVTIGGGLLGTYGMPNVSTTQQGSAGYSAGVSYTAHNGDCAVQHSTAGNSGQVLTSNYASAETYGSSSVARVIPLTTNNAKQ